MADSIQLQLFEQDGVTMARAPDGSTYRLSDVMRYNNPGVAYDDDTGMAVNDMTTAQLSAYEPTLRERMRYGISDFLTGLGVDRYKANQAGDTIMGNPNAGIDGIGLADLTPLAAVFGGQEGARTAAAGYRAGDPGMMAAGGLEAGLGLLEAVPVAGVAARALREPAGRLAADGIGMARAIARGDSDLLSEVVKRGGRPQSLSADVPLPPASNSQRTQIAGTFPTYEKASSILDASIPEGRKLDFGAGLGMSKDLGFDTFEPFPREGFSPTYRSASDIPDSSYDKVTNLNVLNVVPREVRDDIVRNIGRVLAPNGEAIVTTRGRDVLTAKGVAGPEPMSIVTSANTYQKGFTQRELIDYLSSTLGDGFEVTPEKLGQAGAKIRRLPSPNPVAQRAGLI